MSNMEQFSSYLVNNEKKIDELIKNINLLTKNGNKSFDSINDSANSFKELTSEILAEIKKGKFDINDMSKESFSKLNSVLNNLDSTLLQTQTLIDNLNQSPSDILFKQKNIKYGPGEE